MKRILMVITLVLTFVVKGNAGIPFLRFINFGNAEFLIGIKAGLNLATPLVLNRYSVFENTANNVLPQFKTYDKWYKNIGNQFGIMLLLKFGETSYLTFQPSLVTHNVKYSSLYTWQSAANQGEATQLTYKHKQSFKYIEFPVIYRKEMNQQTLRPYIQGGAFYALLQNALQNTSITETMTIGQTSNVVSGGLRSGSTNSQYIRSHIGLIGGAGLAYHFNSVIVCLDGLYKLGLHNITNEKNRYANQPLVGDTFDVPDDLSLNALKVSLNIIFKIGDSQKRRALKCP